ncbi:hypothetical protein BpHYR1_038032 [Brachionus plicatilis]|uniref:Uncharacterized protein n=1 Tax=Brachionus plicatilis TaxID=10195 RepID=A0A3M7R7R4_BRAPC|nr:hypothetical protein BpHYR1_038032 [Brachionus plicatilis]
MYIDEKETENEYTEFICKNFALKSSNYKHFSVSDLGLNETNDKMEKNFFFERLSVGPFHFTISISKNRFCNSFIKKGKEYGQIIYVFKFDEQAFIIWKKMIEIEIPFIQKVNQLKVVSLFLWNLMTIFRSLIFMTLKQSFVPNTNFIINIIITPKNKK